MLFEMNLSRALSAFLSCPDAMDGSMLPFRSELPSLGEFSPSTERVKDVFLARSFALVRRAMNHQTRSLICTISYNTAVRTVYFFMPFSKKKKGALFAVGDVDVFLTPSSVGRRCKKRGCTFVLCAYSSRFCSSPPPAAVVLCSSVPTDCVVDSRVQSLSSGIAAPRELRCGVSVVITCLGSCYLNLCTEMYTGCLPFRDKHYRMVSRQLGRSVQHYIKF